MPSPFPGMDPFLESPARWPGVHNGLIYQVRRLLAAEVDPEFIVNVEERVYITDRFGDTGFPQHVPDVTVVSAEDRPTTPRRSGGPAIATPVPIEALVEEEVHDRYLVLRDAFSHRVITAIEILSPASKVRTSRGYQALDAKRREILSGGASWVEIDLLRGGYRHDGSADSSDYQVAYRRGDDPQWYGWPVGLRDRLPVIGIPLTTDAADALLDLQAALNQVYDEARYGTAIDYGQPVPPPPLRPADEAWVRERLTAWRTV